MKLVSWNVNGLRAVVGKGELDKFLQREQPDVFCLQEVKVKQTQIDFEVAGYQLVLNSAERSGYSGTGMLIKDELANLIDLKSDIYWNMPDEIAEQYGMVDDQFGDPNSEGRVLALSLPDYYIVTVYTPNSKGDLSRLTLRHDKWDVAFLEYMKRLRKDKPVVFCGDLNVAAQEIDLANPKENAGKHGFTDEEREGFANFLKSGFVDSFRAVHGNESDRYTWWTHWAHARERNVGWRIDYFLVDERLEQNIIDATIYANQMGSDHCPIGLVLE